MTLTREYPWIALGVGLLIGGTFVSGFWFSPVTLMILFGVQLLVLELLLYGLHSAYDLSHDPVKLFFSLGVRCLSLFTLVRGALLPWRLSEQTGLFVYAPFIGLFFATLLFLIGVVPRSAAQRETLWKSHRTLSEVVLFTLLVVAVLLLSSPYGIRGIIVLEEQSLAIAESALLGVLIVLLVLAFLFERYRQTFRGFSYDALSRGLIFLTVMRYGLLVTQPWDASWWLFHFGTLGVYVFLFAALRNEIFTQQKIAAQVQAWKPKEA